MTVNLKRFLTIVGLTIVGLIVGIWIVDGLLVLLPTIIAGIIGGFIAAFLIKGPAATIESVRKTAEAMAGPLRPGETDLAHVLSQSLVLNQRVRFEEGVSESVRAAVEKIIDLVEALAPSLCGDFEGEDLTYNVCRVPTYQLPRLLEPYFKVKPADRASVEPNVLKALEAVQSDLAEIHEIFRTQGINAALHRAKTVEMKFAGLGGATAQA
jgi:hypothetical protein